jgi:hypothetical protein
MTASMANAHELILSSTERVQMILEDYATYKIESKALNFESLAKASNENCVLRSGIEELQKALVGLQLDNTVLMEKLTGALRSTEDSEANARNAKVQSHPLSIQNQQTLSTSWKQLSGRRNMLPRCKRLHASKANSIASPLT